MHDVFLVLFVLWAVGRFANQPSQGDPIGEVFKGLFALAAILALLALAIGTTVLAGVYVSINEAGKDSTMHAWMAAGAWAYLGAFFCRYGKKERAEALGYAAVLGVCAIGLVVAAHHTTSPQPVAFVPSVAPAQPAPQPYKVPLNEQYRLPPGSAC